MFKQAATNLPSPNERILPWINPQDGYSNKAQFISQLQALLKQSFDIFNIYGKEPESLENILLGFNLSLEDMEIKYITSAFKEWMASSRNFPTPADIRKIAIQHKDFEKSRVNSSARYTGIVWTQVIRDRETDAILCEYPQGQHKCDFDLSKIFPGKRIHVSMRREG